MLYDHPIKDVRPDSRMRVHLGELAKGADGFKVFRDEDGRLVLEPYAVVPLHEKWVFRDDDIVAGFDKADLQLKRSESSRINWSDWE